MLWALAVVILVAFVYVILTAFHYVNFLGKAGPIIKDLKERADQLDRAIEAERTLGGVIKVRIEQERAGLSHLKLAVAEIQQELKAAEDQKQKLEWEMYKKGKDTDAPS